MISRRWGPPSVANKDANVPLVLLHGLLGDSGDWQPEIDRLPGRGDGDRQTGRDEGDGGERTTAGTDRRR